jgi:hypothetical protein
MTEAGSAVGPFRAIELPFDVVCDDHELAALVGQTFRHCAETVVPVARLAVSVADDQVQLRFDDDHRTCAPSAALQTVVSMVNFHASQRRRVDLPLLHAGAVADERGWAILMPGRSGSGKSTLVATLLTTGNHDYLADELVAVISAAEVAGYPKALTLKAGSWDGITIDRPDRTAGAAFRNTVDYVDPTVFGDCAVQPQAAAGFVVFPTFASGEATTVDALSPGQALLQLCESAYLPLTAQAFHVLAELAARLPAIGVRYGSTRAIHDVIDHVSELAVPQPYDVEPMPMEDPNMSGVQIGDEYVTFDTSTGALQLLG